MTTTEIIWKTPTGKPLPQGWRWVKLEELFDVKQGVAMSPLRRQGLSLHPFLRTLNILWGKVDLSNLDKMDFTEEEITSLKLKNGDLLVCEGGDVGRTAIWKGELTDCLYQNHIHRLRRKNDNTDPEFYMLWMQAAFKVFNSYKGKEITTTIPNLSGGKLKSFMVPLPPTLAEQERIARILNEQMAAIEKARAAAEVRLEAAKALPAAYLRTVFESEEAKGWTSKSIGTLCQVATGGTPSTTHPEYYGGEVPWLKSGDIQGIRILKVPNRISKLGLEHSNAVVHPTRSVMIALSGQGKTRGTSGILMMPSACSQSVAAILPSREVLPELIYFVLVYQYKNIRLLTGDNERTGLNLKIVRNIFIPVPEMQRQKEITSMLEDKISCTSNLIKKIEEELETINALPVALLRRAFTGGL